MTYLSLDPTLASTPFWVLEVLLQVNGQRSRLGLNRWRSCLVNVFTSGEPGRVPWSVLCGCSVEVRSVTTSYLHL